MKKSILLFCLLSTLTFPSFTQAQKPIDSLLKVYTKHKQDTAKVETIYKIVHLKLYTNTQEAKPYIDEMIDISKKINYNIGEAKGYHRLAGYYFTLDKIDSALIYYKKSRKIHKSIGNLSGVVGDNTQLGLIYGRKNEFDSAFYYLDQNVELYNNRNLKELKKNNPFKYIGSTFHTLANIHTSKGSFNLALKEEFKALKHYKKLGDPLYIADAYNSLSAIENELNNHKQGLLYANTALKTYTENKEAFFQVLATINKGSHLYGLKRYKDAIKNNKKGIALAKANNYKGREAQLWSNMGNSYLELGDYGNAKHCFWQSISLHNILHTTMNHPLCYSNLGRLYNKTKQLDSALYYLNRAIKISNSTNQLRMLAHGYLNRSNTHKLQNNYKQSLLDYETYTTLKDSMFNEEKSKQIAELRTIYETEKKELQIQHQKNEIELLNIKGKVNNQQRILLALGLLLSLFGIYSLYQRNKRHKLEKEKAQLDLEYKTKELTTHALHLAKKNEVLNDLKQKAKAFKADANADPGYQMLIQTINFDLQDDNNWENFSRYFEEVYKDFNSNAQLQFPNITSNDLRLMALMKMNLSSKEIANILNISSYGIKKARQRLRKKMRLESNVSLEAIVIAI